MSESMSTDVTLNSATRLSDLNALNAALYVAGMPCNVELEKVISHLPSHKALLSVAKPEDSDYARAAVNLTLFSTPSIYSSLTNPRTHCQIDELVSIASRMASLSQNAELRKDIGEGQLQMIDKIKNYDIKARTQSAILFFRFIFSSQDLDAFLSTEAVKKALLETINMLELSRNVMEIIRKFGRLALVHHPLLSFVSQSLSQQIQQKIFPVCLVAIIAHALEIACTLSSKRQCEIDKGWLKCILSDAWLLALEARVSAFSVGALTPWFRSLSLEDIEGETVKLLSLCSKYFRRSPQTSLPLISQLVSGLKVDLSSIALILFTNTELIALLKNEKLDIRANAIKFVEAVASQVQDGKAIANCIAAIFKPLQEGVTLKVHEKQGLICALYVLSFAPQIHDEEMFHALAPLFASTSGVLLKGLKRDDSIDRSTYYSLAGRFLQLGGVNRDTEVVFSLLISSLTETKATDKSKLYTLESLDQIFSVNSSIEKINTNQVQQILEPISLLAIQAATKPGLKSVSLQALIVLLRLEQLYPQQLESRFLLSAVKQITQQKDSFLNSSQIIQEASASDAALHLNLVALILSFPGNALILSFSDDSGKSILQSAKSGLILGNSLYEGINSHANVLFPPTDEKCVSLPFFSGSICLFKAMFQRHLWSPETSLHKCVHNITTTTPDALRLKLRWILKKENATPAALRCLILAFFYSLVTFPKTMNSLARSSQLLPESSAKELLNTNLNLSHSALRSTLELILDVFQQPLEQCNDDATYTLICLIAFHPAVTGKKSASFYRKKVIKLLTRNNYAICPNVSIMPKLLSLLKEHGDFYNDNTGYCHSYIKLLYFLDPQLCSTFVRKKRLSQVDFSQDALNDASTRITQLLVSYLRGVSQHSLSLSEADVLMFFAPKGKLQVEVGLYNAKEKSDVDATIKALQTTSSINKPRPLDVKPKHSGRLASSGKTREQLDEEEMEEQSKKRESLREKLALMRFCYGCLGVLSRSNESAFEAVFPLVVPEIMALLKCPIFATATLHFVEDVAGCIIKPQCNLASSLLPQVLFMCATGKTSISSRALDALANTNSNEMLSCAALALIQPIVTHLLSNDVPACAADAALSFIVNQLTPPCSPMDLTVIVQSIRTILRNQPERVDLASQALSLLCRNPKMEADLLEAVSLIAVHDDASVRLAVVEALSNVKACSLERVAAFLYVCQEDDGISKTAFIAANILTAAQITPDITVKLKLVEFLSCRSAVFRALTCKALAHVVKHLSDIRAVEIRDELDNFFTLYRGTTSNELKLGVAVTLTYMARENLINTRVSIEKIFSFLFRDGYSDESLPSYAPLLSALETLGLDVIASAPLDLSSQLYDTAEFKFTDLDEKIEGKASKEVVYRAKACFHGAIAKSLESNDEKLMVIMGSLLTRIKDSDCPSRMTQKKIADVLCPIFKTCHSQKQINVKDMIASLLQSALSQKSIVSRTGSALALAAAVKGAGTHSMKDTELLSKLLKAAEHKTDAITREGALLSFHSLSEILGRLFEPSVPQILGTLMTAFSDMDSSVRVAAKDSTRMIMTTMSAHGIKQILPVLLNKITDEQWRTRLGSIEALGAMTNCAPRQLGALLPQMVPQLCEVVSDANPQVKAAAKKALQSVASIITNEEIKGLTEELLAALLQPSNDTLKAALDALLKTEFVHPVDSPALAIMCPIVIRALRERSSETKKKAAAIVASMVHLANEPRDFLPYFPQVCLQLQETSIDPIPNVRAVAAMAFGTISRALGEEPLKDLLQWLFNKLESEDSSVERSGAANGLAQVLAALGPIRLQKELPLILKKAESTEFNVREGCLGLFVFLPSAFGPEFQAFVPDVLPVLLRSLSCEEESIRDVAFRAAEVLISQYGATHTVLLLTPLEEGVFSDNWRIRYSTVSLLGTLVDKLLHFSSASDLASDKPTEILSVERRAFILSSLYIVRSDENLVVRQQASQAWKSVVHNTPKTLKEILPILLPRLLSNLSSDSKHKQRSASRCIDELAGKLSEQILPDLLPKLISMLGDSGVAPRHGACIGLSALVGHAPKQFLVNYSGQLIPTLHAALCDSNPTLQQAATTCLGNLLNSFGPAALPRIVDDILIAITQPPTFRPSDLENSSRAAQLSGISVLLESQHQALMTSVVAACRSGPLDLSRLRLISCVAAISQLHAFNFCMMKVLPRLVEGSVLAMSNIGESTPAELSGIIDLSILEHFDGEVLREETHCSLEKLLKRCGVDASIIEMIIDDLISHLQTTAPVGDLSAAGRQKAKRRLAESGNYAENRPEMVEVIETHSHLLEENDRNPHHRATVADFLGLLVRVTQADLKPHFSQLLQALVPLALCDPQPLVRDHAVQAIAHLNTLLRKKDSTAHVVDLHEIITKIIINPVTQKRDPNVTLSGLAQKSALDTFYSLFHPGPDIRELSAQGLGDLFACCPTDALKPVAVKITGPLIRVAAERLPASVRCALLTSLRTLLLRASAFLRPLLPQIQVSFVKAIPDSSAAVRKAGILGLGCLASLSGTRTEALVTELCTHPASQTDPAILTTILNALRDVLAKLPASCTTVTLQKVTSFADSHLLSKNSNELIKAAAAECLGAVYAKQTTSEELERILDVRILKMLKSPDTESRQASAMILSEIVKFHDIWATRNASLQDSLCNDIKVACTDERTNVKKYGVIAYARILKLTKINSVYLRCLELLDVASPAINSFCTATGTATLALALEGLKSFSKYAVSGSAQRCLTIQERGLCLFPAINALTLVHPGIKLMAGRVLFYSLEVASSHEFELCAQLQTAKAIDPARMTLLYEYVRRVLSKSAREVSDSDEEEN